MSRNLARALASKPLIELAVMAGDITVPTEVRCAALAQITFTLRQDRWALRGGNGDVDSTLEAIREIDRRATHGAWYIRESVDFTVAEIEALLRESR
jgi:hypothetical protein